MTSLCLSKRAFGDVSTFVMAGISRHSSPRVFDRPERMSGGPPSTARTKFHEPAATCTFAVCRSSRPGRRKVTARGAGGAMSEPAPVLEELAALDLDALTGQQMLDLVAELSTAVRPLRSLLCCGLGRPAIVTSGRPPQRRRRLWWEGGSAGSGDAQPGGTQN